MAGVTTREEAPVYAAPAAEWGLAARKYATEFIGSFFLTFAVGVAALTGSVFVPLAAGAMREGSQLHSSTAKLHVISSLAPSGRDAERQIGEASSAG